MVSLSGRCDGHPAGTVGARQSRPTPLATLGGRSTQRHHGVDGVPTPERTVDPTAISGGAPGELAQPPAIREQSPERRRSVVRRSGATLPRWDGQKLDFLRTLAFRAPRKHIVSRFV